MSAVSSSSPSYASAFISGTHIPPLNWKDRPEALKSRIDSAFASVARDTSSDWGCYNGQDGYDLCGADEYKLMESIVRRAPAEQTDFYALDIGCGNFQWGTGLAKHFDKLTDLPRPIKVHIINVRGEQHLGERVTLTSRCALYKLGAFKIEELFEQFKANGLELENKVDLAVSRFTFRHLADPVGTFTQTYDLLRPGSGILSIDGFFMLDQTDSEHITRYDYNKKMIQLFADTKARFIYRYFEHARSLSHLMSQRPDDSKCELPMKYEGLRSIGSGWQNDSECMTVFTREPQESDHKESLSYEHLERVYPHSERQEFIQGDKGLYEWLKQNHIINSAGIVPLYASELPTSLPALHSAVITGDKGALIGALDAGADINESDPLGNTALHLALENNQFELFEILLERKADVSLPNGLGKKMLHIAAKCDRDGQYLRKLLTLGIDVNCKEARMLGTPLCNAVFSVNIVAVGILLDAGACTKYLEQELTKPEFASLHSHPELRRFIFIQIDTEVPVPRGDSLELCGEAEGLSWDAGVKMTKRNEKWSALVDSSKDFPFKVVLKKASGQVLWETGENHTFKADEPHPLRKVCIAPVFG